MSILDDSASYCLDKDGNVTFRNPDRKDCYVFFFPNLYEEAVKTFFRLSGYSPRLPRYAFGNWWSRFYNYTQESYLYQMTTFAQENVPFTVATIDMNWHPSNTNGRNFFKDVGKSVKEFYYRDKDGKQVSYCQGFGDPKDWIIGWTGVLFQQAALSGLPAVLQGSAWLRLSHYPQPSPSQRHRLLRGPIPCLLSGSWY
ncbi:MAG: hypothetical protein LKM30_07535 [Bacilli bacterium]|nr:hypothetical protein [Bacilli bacterium]